MNYYTENQIFVFFIIIGIIISIFFDFFRAIRKNFKSNNFITSIQDVFFIMISSLLIIISIIKLSNGYIRLYCFIGLALGCIIYFLTISNFCVIILTNFVSICKKIINLPIKCFYFIINRLKKYKKKDF